MWTPPLPRWTHFPAGLPTLPDGPMDKTSPSGLGCGLSFRKLASPSSARLTPEQGKAPQTNGTERATLRRGEKAPLLVCVSLLALLDFAAVRPGCGSFFSMRRWHGVLSMEQGERRILEPPPPPPPGSRTLPPGHLPACSRTQTHFCRPDLQIPGFRRITSHSSPCRSQALSRAFNPRDQQIDKLNSILQSGGDACLFPFISGGGLMLCFPLPENRAPLLGTGCSQGKRKTITDWNNPSKQLFDKIMNIHRFSTRIA